MLASFKRACELVNTECTSDFLTILSAVKVAELIFPDMCMWVTYDHFKARRFSVHVQVLGELNLAVSW